MLERADTRLWFSMIGIASAVPAVVFAISAIWFMRFYFAPPTILAAAPRGPSALAQVAVAVPPPAAVPVAPPLAAQTPKPLSTMPRLGDAHPAYFDPVQDISTDVSPVMSAEPAAREPSKPIAGPVPLALAQAEAPAPQLRQQLTEMAEAVAVPDAKASEPASAPPAVAPRMLGDAHPAYSDPRIRLFRSAGHFDRCIPGNVCRARRTRTLQADRGARSAGAGSSRGSRAAAEAAAYGDG